MSKDRAFCNPVQTDVAKVGIASIFHFGAYSIQETNR